MKGFIFTLRLRTLLPFLGEIFEDRASELPGKPLLRRAGNLPDLSGQRTGKTGPRGACHRRPPFSAVSQGSTVHQVENLNFFGKKDNFLPPPQPFKIFSPLHFYEFAASRFGVFPEIKAFSFRAFFKLRELVKSHRFDILHDNQCLGYGMLLWKTLGIPVVSTIHHPLSIDRATWFENPSVSNKR